MFFVVERQGQVQELRARCASRADAQRCIADVAAFYQTVKNVRVSYPTENGAIIGVKGATPRVLTIREF